MNKTNEMQIYRLIYYSYLALHVSGDVFAHHQEHLTVFTASGSIHSSRCQLVSWMSWNAVSTHPWYQLAATWVNTTRWYWYWYHGWYTMNTTRWYWYWCHGWVETQFQLIHDTSWQWLEWILPDAVNTVKCSWWWAKTSPETCRAK